MASRCARRVAAMVPPSTLGLPSMSPPTQVPKRSRRGTSMASPKVSTSEVSRVSYNTGITR
jgi:hypothetical protein